MKQTAIRHHANVAAMVAFAVLLLGAAAAEAAPGKLCSVTRTWVEKRCDKGGRIATPERCTKWLGWLADHCAPSKPDVSDVGTTRGTAGDARPDHGKGSSADKRVDRNTAHASAYVKRSKLKDDKRYMVTRHGPPRQRKHTRKVRSRVIYVNVDRPQPCCEPLVYYRSTPYRDQVFPTDYVLRPGKEAAFFRALEANRR
jgi:hypothetical protein